MKGHSSYGTMGDEQGMIWLIGFLFSNSFC